MSTYRKIIIFICIICCILFAGCTDKKNIPQDSMTICINNQKITSNDKVKINNIIFLLNQCNKNKQTSTSSNETIDVKINKNSKLNNMLIYENSIVYNGIEYTGDQIINIKNMIVSTFFSNKLLSNLIASSEKVQVEAQANYNASHTFTNEEKKQLSKILLNSHNSTYNNTYITPDMIRFPYYKLVIGDNNSAWHIEILNENYIVLTYNNYSQQFNISSEVWTFLKKFSLDKIKDTSDIRYLYYSDKLKCINEDYKNTDLINKKDLLVTILCGGTKDETFKDISKNDSIELDFYNKNLIRTVKVYKDYFIYNNICYKLQNAGDRVITVLKAD